MAEQTEYATDEKIDSLRESIKQSNDDRKRDKLRRQITRAHEWRVQVWAQSELKIRAAQANLSLLDGEVVDLFEPEFDNDEMLHTYSNMPLSK